MATDNTLRDVIDIPRPLTQMATDNTLRDVIDIPQPLTQVLGLHEFESLASHAVGHG
ncbi:hypothetical protein J6590_009880 [Homalodisca vitripennis]|nr:hypothetical protein J6590_009880 [Homalodisca vitripennis]